MKTKLLVAFLAVSVFSSLGMAQLKILSVPSSLGQEREERLKLIGPYPLIGENGYYNFVCVVEFGEATRAGSGPAEWQLKDNVESQLMIVGPVKTAAEAKVGLVASLGNTTFWGGRMVLQPWSGYRYVSAVGNCTTNK